jgi:hypothetical protein
MPAAASRCEWLQRFCSYFYTCLRSLLFCFILLSLALLSMIQQSLIGATVCAWADAITKYGACSGRILRSAFKKCSLEHICYMVISAFSKEVFETKVLEWETKMVSNESLNNGVSWLPLKFVLPCLSIVHDLFTISFGFPKSLCGSTIVSNG